MLVALTVLTGRTVQQQHPLGMLMGEVAEARDLLVCSSECAITFLMTRSSVEA